MVTCSSFSECSSCGGAHPTDAALCAWCPATSACIPLNDVVATAKACPNLLIGVDGCKCSQRGNDCGLCTIDDSCAYVEPKQDKKRSVSLRFDGQHAIAHIVGQSCVPWQIFEPSTGKVTPDIPDGCQTVCQDIQTDWGHSDRDCHQRRGLPCKRLVGNTAVVIANASVTARYVEVQPDYYNMNGCGSSGKTAGSENVVSQFWWILLLIFCGLARQFFLSCDFLSCFRNPADPPAPSDYRRW